MKSANTPSMPGIGASSFTLLNMWCCVVFRVVCFLKHINGNMKLKYGEVKMTRSQHPPHPQLHIPFNLALFLSYSEYKPRKSRLFASSPLLRLGKRKLSDLILHFPSVSSVGRGFPGKGVLPPHPRSFWCGI